MKYPKRCTEIQTTLLPDGHTVLMHKPSSWAHTLSPLGSLVWEFCDGLHTTEEIISSIKAIPGLTLPEALEEEVTQLLKQFAEDGLLAEETGD